MYDTKLLNVVYCITPSRYSSETGGAVHLGWCKLLDKPHPKATPRPLRTIFIAIIPAYKKHTTGHTLEEQFLNTMVERSKKPGPIPVSSTGAESPGFVFKSDRVKVSLCSSIRTAAPSEEIIPRLMSTLAVPTDWRIRRDLAPRRYGNFLGGRRGGEAVSE